MKILSYSLWESLERFGGIRYPDQIQLTDQQKEKVKGIEESDLSWEEIGNNGHNIIWFKLNLDSLDFDISDGVAVDVQLVIDEKFYQLHIGLAEDLKGLGLGTKICKSLVIDLGHIYTGKGRVHNPIIWDLLKKLEDDPRIECHHNEIGVLCVSKLNPDREELISMFRGDRT